MISKDSKGFLGTSYLIRFRNLSTLFGLHFLKCYTPIFHRVSNLPQPRIEKQIESRSLRRERVSALAFEAYARQSVAKLGLAGVPALFRDACVPLGLPVTKDAPQKVAAARIQPWEPITTTQMAAVLLLVMMEMPMMNATDRNDDRGDALRCCKDDGDGDDDDDDDDDRDDHEDDDILSANRYGPRNPTKAGFGGYPRLRDTEAQSHCGRISCGLFRGGGSS